MNNYFIFLLFTFVYNGQSIELIVNNAEEFQDALKIVSPGDFIILNNNGSAGPVTFEGIFRAVRSGTKDLPITLQGHPDIWLKNPNNMSYQASGFMLWRANHWVVSGLNLKESTNGLYISSNNNSFSNIQIIDCVTGITVLGGNDNHFESINISDCITGLDVQVANGTTFSGGEIQGSFYAIGIYRETWNTTVEYFRVTDNLRSMVAIWNTTGPIIRNNTFIVVNDTQMGSIWSISDDSSDGLFEGNDLTYNIHYGYPIILQGSNFVLKWNKIFRGDNRARTMMYLGEKAIGNILKGNEMYFTDLEYPREKTCIRSLNPEFQIKNTIITCDNICEGGKLTDIYDKV